MDTTKGQRLLRRQKQVLPILLQVRHQVQSFVQSRPIVANSILCFGLWVCGDILAQSSEQERYGAQARPLEVTEGNASSSTLIEDNSQYGSDGGGGGGIKKNDNNSKTTTSAYNPFFVFSDRYDWYRTMKCASYGGLVSGPVLAVWYPWLDRVCTTSWKVTGMWTSSIIKVAMDEFVMEPPTLLVFYGYMNIWEGGSYTTFLDKLQAELVSSWITSIVYWPPVTLLTFRYVPLYLQAPIINACCIVWDGYLSHRNAVTTTTIQNETNGRGQELLTQKTTAAVSRND